MFTGIIEGTGVVTDVTVSGSNKTFWVSSPLSDSLKPDQSIAHDGVCLTVEEVRTGEHRVTAVAETLAKTTLHQLQPGHLFNLERCLELPARLDGHIVQGHVDVTGTCSQKAETNGSWLFRFDFPESFAPLLVEKGSIAVNGISLTVFNVTRNSFEVTIIPYTYQHTNIAHIETGHQVNLEFDIVGKYVLRSQTLHHSA